jgi:3-phenylpropionate/cinnamic acid dioxygenase small subunit
VVLEPNPLHLTQKILYFYRCTAALLQVDYEQWFSQMSQKINYILKYTTDKGRIS